MWPLIVKYANAMAPWHNKERPFKEVIDLGQGCSCGSVVIGIGWGIWSIYEDRVPRMGSIGATAIFAITLVER